MSRTLTYLRETTTKLRKRSDKLLERAVERRTERLDILVEVNGSLSTLGNTFRGKLELLQWLLVSATCIGLKFLLTL